MKNRKLFKSIRYTRTILLTALAIVSLMSILSVGPTFAYLKMSATPPAENTLSAAPSVIPSVVTESGATRIAVGNTGGYSVYVRATIVGTWKDSDGNVLGTAPTLNVAGTDEKWKLAGDGYYYYTDPVASEEKTLALYTSCTAGTPPEGAASFCVDVLAQTVQAVGTTSGRPAVTIVWGCTVNDDKTITHS